MKVVENLHEYQAEMKIWRDKKVKEQAFDDGDLVLLQSPSTECSGKLQLKLNGPYLVAKKKNKAKIRP
jgi:hypothetical protein